MTTKRIVFIIMCAMLLLTVIIAAVVVGKVAPVLGALMDPPDNTTTGPSTTQTDPSTQPTQTDPSTQPSTQPTQTDPSTQPSAQPHTHAFTSLKEDVKPTCDSVGYQIYQCECGEQDMETIDKLNHTFGVGKLVSPTCTEEGYTERKCSACGTVEKQDVQEPLEHDFKLVETVQASCEDRGYDEFKCARAGCGKIDLDNVVEATGHSWVKGKTYAPTCTGEGYTEYTCSNVNCEQKTKQDDKTEPLGHTFGSWKLTKDPAAGKPGEEERECSVCKEKETREYEVGILTEKGINSSQDGDEWHYIINVGSKNSAGKEITVYSYRITDYSGLISKNSFTYDPEAGLVITFQDKAGKTQSYVLTPGNYTFTIDKDGNQAASAPDVPESGAPAASEPTGSQPAGEAAV